MILKKLCQICLFISILFLSFSLRAVTQNGYGDEIANFFKISSRWSQVEGNPQWLLITRDIETGLVRPFIYDIATTHNLWLSGKMPYTYRIVASQLTFDDNHVINNFCNLEKKVFSHLVLMITLSGRLTPNRHTSSCHVTRYQNMPFPIVKSH